MIKVVTSGPPRPKMIQIKLTYGWDMPLLYQ